MNARRDRPREAPAGIAGGVCLAALALAPALVSAREPRAPQESALRREITSELRLGVARGLKFLIQRQEPSGDFDGTVPVAANALAGLAFLAGGTTEEIGPADHVAALKRCTDALLARQDGKGYFDDGKSRMYGHGFATLYLTELYGTTRRDHAALRQALKRAITLIERSQSADGGWDYIPAQGRVVGGRGSIVDASTSDTSITVCQTMALRAAQNLGLAVDRDVITRARRYIERAQNPDGGFRYRQTGDRFFQQGSAFPRSAAGVCILYSLGVYQSDSIRRGVEYLDEHYTMPSIFPFYGHYYCAQAMFQVGGKHWRGYFPWVRESLLSNQRPDGGWHPGKAENGAQASAMALIILQLPYRFLPIHER